MDAEDIVWGMREIAAAIRCNEKQAEHLRRLGKLPIRKVGGRLVASRRALHAALVGPELPTASVEPVTQ